jgi:hypothetical protein
MAMPARQTSTRRTVWIVLLAAAGLAAALYGAGRLRRQTLQVRPKAAIPGWSRAANRDVVAMPDRFLVGELARYDDEFFAWLMFSYLAGAPELKGGELLLSYSASEGRILYSLRIGLPNDLLSGIALLCRAEVRGLAQEVSWNHVTKETLDRLRGQTRLFRMAYDLPPRDKLETLKRAELVGYIRRWVRFKSATDPRTRRQAATAPAPLNSEDARQLAEDIVSVANFFALPLDFFLGIGAMENNYLNIAGDLQHSVWKRRAEKGDIVLKRKPGKVLVVNSSLGAWQITRETLRYAHRLYRKDARDYSRLPARLRPPLELDFANIDPAVLTTYAGLLFRDLLDRCGGDVTLAVGAYNGGLGRPNLGYADGVRAVAEYARRIMEHAAVLNGPAAGRHFIRPAHP